VLANVCMERAIYHQLVLHYVCLLLKLCVNCIRYTSKLLFALEFEVLLQRRKYVATVCMAASFTSPVHLNVSHLVLSGLVMKEQAVAQVAVIVWSES
jgi:hypothetical protein